MTDQGYPCGNFSIAGALDDDGRLFARLQINPGQLGQHVQRFSGGGLVIQRRKGQTTRSMISTSATALHDRDCQQRWVERQWPLSRLELADPLLGPITIRAVAFAPSQPAALGLFQEFPVCWRGYACATAASRPSTICGLHGRVMAA